MDSPHSRPALAVAAVVVLALVASGWWWHARAGKARAEAAKAQTMQETNFFA